MTISVDSALSGLMAAQRAAQVAGHNIANASTPGYRRQSLELRPAEPISTEAGPLGSGVKMQTVRGHRDDFLFGQLLNQEGATSKAKVLSGKLSQIELTVGSDPEAGLNQSINRFFDALADVESNPDTMLSRKMLVDSASMLSADIRRTYSGLQEFREDLLEEFNQKVDEVNANAEQVAELNKQIQEWSNQNFEPNDLIDHRDELVRKLGSALGVQRVRTGNNISRVLFDGGMLANSWTSTSLEVVTGDDASQSLKLRHEGGTNEYQADTGELGAIQHLRDDLIPEYMDQLDRLASAMIETVNKVHAGGVGLDGGISSITSSNRVSSTTFDPDPSDNIISQAGLPFEMTAGDLRISVTNTQTGEVEQTAIAIDPDSDTLTSLAGKFAAVDNMNAVTNDGRLSIFAQEGYRFDFSGRIDPNPGDMGTATFEAGGTYTGTVSDTLTFVASSSGTTGQTQDLSITAFNSAGNALGTYSIGEDYNPERWIDGPQGIKLSLGDGDISTAEIISTNTDTFDLSAQGTIDIVVNGGAAQTVDLNNSDFFDVAQAPAQAVVDSINQQAQALGAGFAASVVDGKVRIEPDSGPAGTIELEGPAGDTDMLDALGLVENSYAGGVTGSNAQPLDLSAGGSFNVYVDDPGKTTPYTIDLDFDDLYDMTAVSVDDLAGVIDAQTTGVDTSTEGGSLHLTSNVVDPNMSIQVTDGGNSLTDAIGLTADEATADTTSLTVLPNDATDSSGILTALGINGFFKGSGAADIDVDDRIASDPRQFAAAVSDPPGDNLNVAQMIRLQQETTVGGTQTYNSAFAQLVGRVGSDTQQNNVSYDAQRVLTDGLLQRVDSVSGVSIDEEVANLMMYQQSYQASARVLSTMNTLLETLVNL